MSPRQWSPLRLDAWREGSDRWKDFAHVSLAVLHPIGVPARYACG